MSSHVFQRANFRAQFTNENRVRQKRNSSGFSLVEMLCSTLCGGFIMAGVFSGVSSMYSCSTLSQNQILASNMAQEVLDNSRNMSFTRLYGFLNGGTTVTQTIPLYAYPQNPANSVFQRPLLRNQADSEFNWSNQTRIATFRGTVTETLTDLGGSSTGNGLIRIQVSVTWADQRGNHSYTTGTTVAQTGIHN